MSFSLDLVKSKLPGLAHLLVFWVGFSQFILFLLSRLQITSANTFLLWGMFFIFVGTVSYQLFYALLYHFEPEWAMKYKIVDVDWPWKSDPEGFRRSIFRQISVHVRALACR